jgi:hypothetical protein
MLALHRNAATVFAAVWLTILAAAAIGNYPTPLLGYGGSGVLGYLLCLAALPRSARRLATEFADATADEDRPISGSQFAAS